MELEAASNFAVEQAELDKRIKEHQPTSEAEVGTPEQRFRALAARFGALPLTDECVHAHVNEPDFADRYVRIDFQPLSRKIGDAALRFRMSLQGGFTIEEEGEQGELSYLICNWSSSQIEKGFHEELSLQNVRAGNTIETIRQLGLLEESMTEAERQLAPVAA